MSYHNAKPLKTAGNTPNVLHNELMDQMVCGLEEYRQRVVFDREECVDELTDIDQDIKQILIDGRRVVVELQDGSFLMYRMKLEEL